MIKKTFYVTTPIYYPSGKLHIGHAYTTTLAWVLKNYKQKLGYDAKLLTGADEHGQKIEQKSRKANIDPQVYVDKMSESFKSLWTALEIEYDYFSRTTSAKHKNAVGKIFDYLLNAGLIYKGTYKGLYSIEDEEFLTPTQALKKNGKYYHPTSLHKLNEVAEESYFLKNSQFTSWLKNHFKNNPEFIFPQKIKKEILNNFINKGLEDLSVSRNSFSWGVPIKSDSKHVIYVWLDALNNYISALGFGSKNQDDFHKYWENGDEIVHIIGKEITRFHCIYWPIILKALNLRLPTKILAHGWIITSSGKMSKSKGNVIDPLQIIEKYGAEQLKYFLASQINIGQDGTFNNELFENVLNSDLSNNFGNLLSRTISMFEQNFDKPVIFQKTTDSLSLKIRASIESYFNNYQKLFNNHNVSSALQEAVKLSKDLNAYIDLTMPWKLKHNKQKLGVILNNLLNGLYAVSAMLSVVMPNKMNESLRQLNLPSLDFDKVLKFTKFDSIIVSKKDVLFKRI